MRLATLLVQNFRSCSNVTVNFGDYTCLIGPNGAGKSTILTALNILFRNTTGAGTDVATLDREDFCGKDTSNPIIITATFDDLTPTEEADLAAYARHGKLVVSAKAIWKEQLGRAEVKQYGSRQVMRDFAKYFDASKEGVKAPELKALYQELRSSHPGLPSATTKAAMEEALRAYEDGHPELCELLESEDQFYGWSKGANRLSKFIQWVYIPAVKDASGEQQEARNTALGDLLQRTIRTKVSFDDALTELHDEVRNRYAGIVEEQQESLKELASSLEKRLQRWAHPGSRVELLWNTADERLVSLSPPMAKVAIGEHSFVGEVARSGHGMQRAFIVTMLQELAEIRSDASPTLLLGFEEPELYQHPPQARHLAGVLEDLSASGAQVIVTTHSPYFVSGRGFESMRIVRKGRADGIARVRQLTHTEVASRLADAMGEAPQTPTALMGAVEQIMQPSQNEMFFCNVPILVEGMEDIAFITTHLKLSGQWGHFRKAGCHFIVALGKTNLSRPLAIANGLGIPTYVIFDGDADDVKHKAVHERDNGCILRLCGHSTEAWPTATFWGHNVTMWHSKIGNEVMAQIGSDIWNTQEDNARKERGLTSGIKRKNTLLVTATLERAWKDGHKSALLGKLCTQILDFASKVD